MQNAGSSRHVPAQIELWTNQAKYENKGYVLPKHLDKKVVAVHLDKAGSS